MNASPPLPAVLDANVLFPPSLRDVLLYSAAFRLFLPLWSTEILEELRRNLVSDAGLTEDEAATQTRHMMQAFPKAMRPVDAALAATLTNHPKDRHVLAVAITAGAPVIVTQNVRDFPPASLAGRGITVYDADTFLCALLEEDPDRMATVIRFHAGQLRNPPQTPAQLVRTLSRHAPEFARSVSGLL